MSSCSAGTCFIEKPAAVKPRKSPAAALYGAAIARRRVAPMTPSATSDAARVIPAAEVMRGDAPGESSRPSGCADGAACGGCGPSCGCAPCREAHPVAAQPSGALVTVAMPASRAAPQLALRPSGAVVRVRPWDALSLDERRALYGLAADRAIDATRLRPAGDPVPLYVQTYGVTQPQWDGFTATERQDAVYGGAEGVTRSLAALAARNAGQPANQSTGQGASPDALPAWAREDGITQQTWGSMNTTAREAARQQHVAASGQGWQTAQTIITQGTSVVNQILRGELDRDLERIRAQASTQNAQARADADRFVAETNRQRGELELAAAQARAQGNGADVARFETAIQAITAAQQQAQGQQSRDLAAIIGSLRDKSGLSTPAMIAAGVGGLALLGGVVYLATRKR